MEYIEREKVLEIAKDEYYSDFHKSMADLTSLRELLEDTPAADVVEVVRCKDCKYSRPRNKSEKNIYFEDVIICESCEMTDEPCAVLTDDFCSYGERKDGE